MNTGLAVKGFSPKQVADLIASAPYYIAREPSDSCSWSPNWRHETATFYGAQYRRAVTDTKAWRFPVNDRDPLVGALFQRYSLGDFSNKSVNWAYEVEQLDEEYGFASMISALTLGGLSTEGIAAYMHVPTEHIRVFQMAFFDVVGRLNNKHLISKIVYPTNAGDYDNLNQHHKDRRLMFHIAHHYGWQLMIEFADNMPPRDAEDAQRRAEIYNNSVFMAQQKHGLSIPTRCDFRPTDSSRGMELTNTLSMSKMNAPDSSLNDLNAGLAATYVTGSLADIAQAKNSGMSPESQAKVLSAITKAKANASRKEVTIEVDGVTVQPTKKPAAVKRVRDPFSIDTPKRASMRPVM